MAAAMPSVQSLFGLFIIVLSVTNTDGQNNNRWLNLFDRFGSFDRFNFPQPAPRGMNPSVSPTLIGGLNPQPVGLTQPAQPTAAFVVSNIPDPIGPCQPKPSCPPPGGLRYYRPNGACNNPLDGSLGTVDHPLKRLLPAAYADGRGKPRVAKSGQPLPSARKVSNTMQDLIIQRSTRFSQMLPFWGQYMDHDITNSPVTNRTSIPVNCACGSADPACVNIPVETNDLQYLQEGKTCLPVVRSAPVPDAKCDVIVRQQKNIVTSFIDAGTVYGGSQHHMDELLDINSASGELKIAVLTPHGLQSHPNHPILPVGSQVDPEIARFMACPIAVHKPANVPCFAAGDERANENSVLSSVHTMFLRFHNKIVRELHQQNPSWTKDKRIQLREGKMKFNHFAPQENLHGFLQINLLLAWKNPSDAHMTLSYSCKTTRMILAAVHQVITYKQFLPVVLGRKHMKRFGLNLLNKGYSYAYDASYDPSVANSFSAASYRFGHTLIPESMPRSSPNWNPSGANLLLRDSFFNANPLLLIINGGMDSLVRGVTHGPSLRFDSTLANDMRNFLFAADGRLGNDLLAINLERAREHGIPGYNAYRELASLKKATTWTDFVEIPYDRRMKLQQLYSDVDDVDLFIGGISETSVPGGVVGPTFAYLIATQFRDLKQGDQLWHENGGPKPVFTASQLKAIRRVTLSRLVCDTIGGTKTIQPNPFLQSTVPGNGRKLCGAYPTLDLRPWSGYQPLPSSVTDDTEMTQWFPLATDAGFTMDPVEGLRYFLLFRSDDVCKNPVGSETRSVRGKLQIRFKCPPGTIRGTDFPPTDIHGAVWTDWEDYSSPNYTPFDDVESRATSHSCTRAIEIQAQTTSGVPARETGDVFRKFGVLEGLVCRGEDQVQSARCSDYRVRYLCKDKVSKLPDPTTPYQTTTTHPPNPTLPTVAPYPHGSVWTPWSNSDSPVYDGGDFEFKFKVSSLSGFCNNPTQIEARTVLGHIPAQSTGDTFQNFSPGVGLVCRNSHQHLYICKDYEVRYLCNVNDINP